MPKDKAKTKKNKQRSASAEHPDGRQARTKVSHAATKRTQVARCSKQHPASHKRPKAMRHGMDGPSAQRTQAGKGAPGAPSPCPHRQCGACPLIEKPYDEQLHEKQAELDELFANAEMRHPILGMEDPTHYRNKVISPFAPGRILPSAGDAARQHTQGRHQAGKSSRATKTNRAERREILTGMYAAGTHRIVNTDGCLVENEAANTIVQTIRQLMPRFRMTPYDEDSNTGFLRHAVVRAGHASGEILVTLVTNGQAFPGSRNFCRELVRRCPEITTVVQNVNTRQTNVILSDEGERTLYGPGFILDTLCGLSFRISSHSFYQVNARQTEVLYRRAIEMAHFAGTELALDAYCGTGTIGLVAARGLPGAPEAHAARVIGVDKVESAIADARANAQHNGIDNADFATADAGQFMQELASDGENLDVLLMDPPRAGASKAFLEATCTLAPKRIVYISCNPKTQVRDAAYLVRHGYRLVETQGVDMFPHTSHIENICAFER